MYSRFFKYEAKEIKSNNINEPLKRYLKFKHEYKSNTDYKTIENQVFKKNRDPREGYSAEENDVLYRAPAKIGESFTVKMLLEEYSDSISVLKKMLIKGNDVTKPLIALEIIYHRLPSLLAILEFRGAITDETPVLELKQCTIS